MEDQLIWTGAEQGSKSLASLSPRDGKLVSLIGEGIFIEGTVDFGNGALRLDGRFKGKIVGTGTLLVGEKGVLQGELNAGTLIVGGCVKGNVTVGHLTYISGKGKFFGTLQTAQLVIEEGGILDGECRPLETLAQPAIPS